MIIVLGGPIQYWWENWDSKEARSYRKRRNDLSAALVLAGHLIYRPHEAFKGNWDHDGSGTERGQRVNDVAVDICDVFIDMSPLAEIPSPGTKREVDRAKVNHKHVIYARDIDIVTLVECVDTLAQVMV